MRILAVDMGTGTQDILLFDSERPIENCVKMVMPSATEIAARRIRHATRDHSPVVLTGVIAGGGPCSWALDEHIRHGLPAFATPDAARTFNDNLDEVRASGVTIVSEDEARSLDGEPIELRDLDLEAVRGALAAFDEPVMFDGLALGCLDHGDAPPGVSDRLFRFDHLQRTVAARNDLLAFARRAEDLEPYLTRARALCGSALGEGDVAFMDTGPAAALGALHDEAVGAADERIVVNLGNMHLLGFHLRGRQVASLFEHHTGEVSAAHVERFTHALAAGTLTHADVFGSKGHGAYHHDRSIVRAALPAMVAATGPRRSMIRGTSLHPYFAAPFGDMMLGGCFGLLRGYAEVFPAAADAVASRLGPLP